MAGNFRKFSCKYPNCNNSYFTNVSAKNKQFFRFNSKYLRKWKDALKLSSSQDVYSWHICEDHFRATDFKNPLKTALKYNAVPLPVTEDNATENQVKQEEMSECLEEVSTHSNDSNNSNANVNLCCSAPTTTCFSCTCDNASSSTVVCEDLETGINYALLEHLQIHVSKLKTANRRCTLIFGTMSLQKGFHYEHNKQLISGFEDLGSLGRTNKSASYALVFMVRGLRKQFKQVVAYYFTSNATDTNNLSSLIKETITELQKIGLIVVGTVCNQTSTNQEALSQLCAEQNSRPRPFYFLVNGQPIVTIYNMCHLFKSTRNAMLKRKIQFEPNKYARFEHIQYAFNHDQRCEIKSMPHLKPEYFQLLNSNAKLKVKVAARTLSSTVAAYVDMLSSFKILPANASCTAEFAQLMDDLFDSMNGSNLLPPSKNKKYRCALSENSPHLYFWSKLFAQMSNHWKIKDLRSGQDCTKQYKFIKGWQTTLKSIIFLWKHLTDSNVSADFKFLNLRSLNLDPVENLFYCIRQNLNNTKPTCFEFSAALKTVVANRFAKPVAGGNCEEDNCTPLGDFYQLHVCKGNRLQVSEADLNLDLKHEGLGASGMKNILRKLKVPDCDICENNLYLTNKTPKYASETLMEFLQNVHKNLYEFLNQDSHKCLLEDTFISIFLEHYVFKFCSEHNTNKTVLDLVVPYLINRYVNNQIPTKKITSD